MCLVHFMYTYQLCCYFISGKTAAAAETMDERAAADIADNAFGGCQWVAKESGSLQICPSIALHACSFIIELAGTETWNWEEDVGNSWPKDS